MKKRYYFLFFILPITLHLIGKYVLNEYILIFLVIESFILGIIVKSLFNDIWEFSISEEKNEYEENMVQVESESVYCSICSACGEEECCSPLLCHKF